MTLEYLRRSHTELVDILSPYLMNILRGVMENQCPAQFLLLIRLRKRPPWECWSESYFCLRWLRVTLNNSPEGDSHFLEGKVCWGLTGLLVEEQPVAAFL